MKLATMRAKLFKISRSNEPTFTVLAGYSICSVRKTGDGWVFNSVIANVLTENETLKHRLIDKITDELKHNGWSWVNSDLIVRGEA